MERWLETSYSKTGKHGVNMLNRIPPTHPSKERMNNFYMEYMALSKAKSRKYQGVFEVKSRVKTWQVRGIGLNNWSTSKSQNGGRNQVSGRVSVPCWLAKRRKSLTCIVTIKLITNISILCICRWRSPDEN